MLKFGVGDKFTMLHVAYGGERTWKNYIVRQARPRQTIKVEEIGVKPGRYGKYIQSMPKKYLTERYNDGEMRFIYEDDE